ncbi:MAG: hypothetical protein IT440_10755 [Phycisphaeraceae bacterium]|nr:hypothetical protein [Phycisphaeraceae bacterium]
MSSLWGFRLVTGLYFLFLGLWFGSLVMLAVTAAVTFKTVRAFHPTLQTEPYNHPNLVPHADNILAGAIVGNSLLGLAVIQTICAVLVMTTVAAQFIFFRDRMAQLGWVQAIRVALIAVPMLVLAADRKWVTPSVWRQRQIMYDPTLDESIRQLAREKFGHLHKLNERMVAAATLMLAAALLISPFVLIGDKS